MTTLKAVERQYGALAPGERFRLVVAAVVRDDRADLARLVDTCPRRAYSMPDAAYTDRVEALHHVLGMAIMVLLDFGASIRAAAALEAAAAALMRGIREGYTLGYRAGWRGCHVLAGDGGPMPDHVEALAVVVEGLDNDGPAVAAELALAHQRQVFDAPAAAAFCRAFDEWAEAATGATGLELVGFYGPDLAARAARVWSAVEGLDPDPEALADWREGLAKTWGDL